jgi:hypothetical protein
MYSLLTRLKSGLTSGTAGTPVLGNESTAHDVESTSKRISCVRVGANMGKGAVSLSLSKSTWLPNPARSLQSSM